MEERRLHIPLKIEKLFSDLLVALTLPDLSYLQFEAIQFLLRLKVAKLLIATRVHRGSGRPAARGGPGAGCSGCSSSGHGLELALLSSDLMVSLQRGLEYVLRAVVLPKPALISGRIKQAGWRGGSSSLWQSRGGQTAGALGW